MNEFQFETVQRENKLKVAEKLTGISIEIPYDKMSRSYKVRDILKTLRAQLQDAYIALPRKLFDILYSGFFRSFIKYLDDRRQITA